MNYISEATNFILEVSGSANPFYIIVAIALLPLFGFPVSPLMVAAGHRLGYLGGFMLVFIGLSLNFSIAYLISKKLLRVWILSFIERRGLSVPKVSCDNMYSVTIIVRSTPGIPLFIQNYILGVAGIHFKKYLIVSLIVHSVYGFAFVVVGDALTGSRIWQILIGCGLLVSVVFILYIIRRNFEKQKHF